MAGNKFRTFRNNEKDKEDAQFEEAFGKDTTIVFNQDYPFLTKPRDEEQYRTNIICKKDSLKIVNDVIKSGNRIYLKVKYIDKNGQNAFRYIPYIDKEGNEIIKKYESNSFQSEKMEKKSYNLETYGSIKLGEVKDTQMTQEDLRCHKKADELMKKMMFSYITGYKGNLFSLENNFDYLSPEMNSKLKEPFVQIYLSSKEKKSSEQKTPSLNKDFTKGVQVIVRPLKNLKKLSYPTCSSWGLTHVFVRYYDKEKGIDKVIESTSEFTQGYNEIIIKDFKIEELAEYKGYEILQNEELTGEKNYYENAINKINKKYLKGNKLIKGEYSLFKLDDVYGGCCFHFAMEIINLFEKSDEKIKQYYYRNEKLYHIYEFAIKKNK